MVDWLRHKQVARSDSTALEFDTERVSYAQLVKRSCQVANGLIAAGVAHGDRVAVMDKNSHRYLELLLGCSLAGAVPVGVNWRLAPPEVTYIINDANAPVLFCGLAFAELIAGIRDDLPAVHTLIATDFDHAQWAGYEQWRDRQSTDYPSVQVSPDDTMIQLYTSGTTGHPKGAELTHKNLLDSLDAVDAANGGWYDWQQTDVNMVCMPMFHIAGVNWALLGLLTGARNLILADVDLDLILTLIEREGVSRVLFVPAVILFLMQYPATQQTNFASLKQVTYGASPIPEELLKQAMAVFGCDLIQIYGLTETSGATSHMSAEDHRRGGDRLRSCGRANPGVEVQIRDDNDKPLPQGEIGEIVTRGRGIMKGYWNAAEKTAEAFRNGWFHTGDAGYFDADGYLYIHDRIKDMIISGGENIYPAEVESALFSHPDIADVAVIGIPDQKWGETVHAVIVPAPGKTPPDLTAVQTFSRPLLAGYKVPRSVEVADALPRNPSGKILRRQLREKYWQGKTRSVN